MRGLLIRTVDRWAPCLIAVVTLFLVIGIGWINSERVAKLEGMIAVQDKTISRLDVSLREDVRMYQTYVLVLQRKMIEYGMQVPDLKPTDKKEK
jgi:uncharacterized coiled-coil protein SlyX